MQLDNILIISPGYVDAILECMGTYSTFSISGYSDVRNACNGLGYIPGNRYLGFSYVNDKIRAQDVAPLLTFLHKLDVMYEGLGVKVPFIFILSKHQGGQAGSYEHVRSILGSNEFRNISFGYYNFHYLSDKVIKRELFGTLLLNKRSVELVEAEILTAKNSPHSMNISLPFSADILGLFEPLTFIEVDNYLETHRGLSILCMLRRYQYNPDLALKAEIEDVISRMVDIDEQITYTACFKLILKQVAAVKQKKG